MKRVIIVCACLMVLMAFVQPAAAVDGDGLKEMFSNMYRYIFQEGDKGGEAPAPTPYNSIGAGVLPERDKYEALDNEVDRLATSHNLEQLYAVMDSKGYSAVRVDVMEDGGVERTYYLIRDVGVVQSYSGDVDEAYKITYDQALEIADMVKDGNVTFGERVEIAHILNGRPKFYEYIKLSMEGIRWS